jgi:hypothetical protein
MTMYRSPGAVETWNYGAPPPGGAVANRGAFAKFSKRAVENEKKSEAAGSAVFEEQTEVQIFMPADNLSAPTRRVVLADGKMIGKNWTEQFAHEWEAFSQGREQMPDGTPLEHWPMCTVALAATLRAIHIHTVEQLAEASDSILDKLMGAAKLRAQARAFVETARDSAANQRLAAEAEQARQDRQQMHDRLKEMEQKLALITQSQHVLSGATSVVQPVPVTPAVPLDPMAAAAIQSGGVPVDEATLNAMAAGGRRGPGRPRKEG